MNHDAAHCADFDQTYCPQQCYRAQLMRDLSRRRNEFIGVPLTYVHFREAGLCQIDFDEVRNEDCEF